MKIFLTGGTGFVGSHFINKAHDAGHEIISLKRRHSKSRIDLNKEPEWVYGNLDDNMSKYFKNCDVVYHLAAHSTNTPYDSLEKCLYWNVNASLKLMQSALDLGIKKFVIAGTGFEYGLSGMKYKYIPINAPLLPTMSYPASKAAGSIIFHQWTVENQIKLQYLRFFQVFGEGEDKNRLWPSLKKAAEDGTDFSMTSSEQIRDFTPVKQVADELMNAINFVDVIPGEPLYKNIGTGRPCSVREFASKSWEKFNASGKLLFGEKPYRENEVMRFVPEI